MLQSTNTFDIFSRAGGDISGALGEFLLRPLTVIQDDKKKYKGLPVHSYLAPWAVALPRTTLTSILVLMY